MNQCGLCGYEIGRDDVTRHFGTFVAHDESRCRELLKLRIAALEAQVDALVEALGGQKRILRRVKRLIQSALISPPPNLENPEENVAIANTLSAINEALSAQFALFDLPAFATARDERLRAEGAEEVTNELAILRNARRVGEYYLRECIESRQSRDQSGNITNSWAVVVIPDWQFRQMIYGIEPEASAADLAKRGGQ